MYMIPLPNNNPRPGTLRDPISRDKNHAIRSNPGYKA